ncbi:MAG: LysR family transcriptional regulator substrate-binding protein [Ilumatobacteraceae bacterium]
MFAEDLVIVTVATHPVARREEVSIASLAAHPLLLPPRGTALRRMVDRAAAAVDVELTTAVEVDGVRLLTSLAEGGLGPAIIPATSLPQPLPPTLRAVAVPELPRRVVGWVARRRPAPTAAARATLALLRAGIARHGHEQPGVHVTDVSPFANR